LPRIAAVGTAVPTYRIGQEETRDVVRQLFSTSFADIERLLGVFDTAQIDNRYVCVPLDWFATPHGFAEKNRLYIANAVPLAAAAIRSALDQAGHSPDEIDHLVFVSSTGLATPSIDAHLINELNLRPDVKRTPIWGLGCAGGAAGLARGFDFAAARPDELVVVCCVELCGLTFVHGDRSKSNLIATSLFGDGAAAVVLYGDRRAAQHNAQGPHLLASRSTIWPDSLDVMGWDVQDDGLKVIFSRDIPTLVQNDVRPFVEQFCRDHGVALHDLDLIAHPGGLKVLHAYRDALGLPASKLQHAADVLRHYGNMSSCTVLFVLERALRDTHQPGDHGLVLALGPGFSCEQVMIQWT